MLIMNPGISIWDDKRPLVSEIGHESFVQDILWGKRVQFAKGQEHRHGRILDVFYGWCVRYQT